MKELLKRSRFIVGVVRALRGAVVDVQMLVWSVTRIHKINAYLACDQPKKLHLGASNSLLLGWLNTDLFPTSPDVIYLDATRRFPFDDSTFDYVFSEHMIEHIDYHCAVTMLRECYRVLKPGGRLRIATPDLEVLIGLHANEKTDSQKKYIDWVTDRCRLVAGDCQDVFVINNAFRAWGHCFLYDRKTLSITLAKMGFRSVKCYEPGVSEDTNLVGLEAHGKEIQAEEINQFETLVVEGESDKRDK
jgi:predicted SAM-dependent methyltransferase